MEPPRMFRLSTILAFLAVAAPVFAQSGTKGGTFIKRPPTIGAGADPNAPVPGERPLSAVGGHDVVSIRSGAPKPGSREHETKFDGQIYRFADEASLKKFSESPSAMAPVMSGWSVVAWVNEKILKPGLPAHSLVHQDRLHLFASTAEKDAFTKDPAKFADADLLLKGVSPVALVDQERTVMGSQEHEVICEGWRVRFANAKEKDAFLADLGKYYPTFAGADPVAFHLTNQVMMGDPKNAFLYKNRLYLFANVENADRFRTDYKTFSDLDVAEAGHCPVCRVDENRKQLGKYGISTIHLGRRLLFASEGHRKKFLADPVKYLPDAKKKSPIP
jgi:YHS domain-containing protein